MFSIIVLVHELWHFSTARFFWVKVEEFGLWIPPKAKKVFTDKKWTIYTLNWLPLGWFVRLKWEDPTLLEDKDDKEALVNKRSWQQAIIILAWVFMNFVLAIFIFSILFFVWVKPIWINDKISTNLDLKLIPTPEQAINIWLLTKKTWVIIYPVKDSVAEKSWLKKEDILTWIELENLEKISISSKEEIMAIVWKNSWKKINFIVERNWKNEVISVIPKGDEKNIWKIWAYLSDNISLNKDFKYKYGFFESIKYGTLETYNQSLLTFKWIVILIKKIVNPETPKERQEAVEQMSWPIWIVDFVSNSLKAGFVFIIIIWAIISINLWVFNLLPIPALDWWRFVFITINSILMRIIWKKAITPNVENFIHFSFFVVLILLSLFIWYNDVTKILDR